MNNYILQYYQQIKEGTEPAGKWVAEFYKRIIDGLQDKAFTFSQKKAEHAIRFIECFCRHHEGALAPNLIKLELWQKAMLSVMFGIMDKDGSRQFREFVILIGRKNGKTLLAAAIAAYMVYADGEYGARVYFVAPKLDQANICFSAFYQMVKAEPELNEITRKRRTDVYVESNNSSAQPQPFSARKSDGLNIHLGVCDEIAAWIGDPGLKQYEVLKSSMGARRQPMMVSISTAGYENDGIFDELMKRSTAVIQGTSHEKRLAPFLYMIDDVAKWNDINELRKANPNLGVSVSVDYLLEEMAVAEGSLSKKAEFMTKYCNVKQNSSLAWLSTETIRRSFHVGGTEEKRLTDQFDEMETAWLEKMRAEAKITEAGNRMNLEDFRRCYALAGIDLSQTTDLTACTLLIQRCGVLYYFTKFFMPREKVEEATARDGLPYRVYIQRGLLAESGDNFVDYMDCFNWFRELIEKYKIYVQAIGIDRYCAQYLQKELEGYGFHCDTVFQGTNLTGVINTAEGLMKDGTLQCANDNDLMKVHLLDAALKTEAESNRKKLIKINKNAHVDGVASLLDALCMRANKWDELGSLLMNKGR